MELTMTNNFGFCELNEQEMMETEGGVGLITSLVIAYRQEAANNGGYSGITSVGWWNIF